MTWDKGRRLHDGDAKTMIFTVAQIVAYCLHIITTGTPPGVGVGQKPGPWYLRAGDVVTLGIETPGGQRQDFVAWTPRG